MNWTIKPVKQLKGEIDVPADKSITHRAVMLAALANGKSIIMNYLDGEDCMRTVQAFRNMGVKIDKDKKALFVLYFVARRSIIGVRAVFVKME